ncbi:MAG: nuclear transport factor 2 family protein, partial [Chlorobi bacterium]|nr:nuclear transport factor 2 family protein [Chlorobiota bacterium]
LGDLKIDVFGDVAVVTFEADFRPTMQEQVHQIWANVTLVFVKVNDTWKITHEHFSQFEKTKRKEL